MTCFVCSETRDLIRYAVKEVIQFKSTKSLIGIFETHEDMQTRLRTKILYTCPGHERAVINFVNDWLPNQVILEKITMPDVFCFEHDTNILTSEARISLKNWNKQCKNPVAGESVYRPYDDSVHLLSELTHCLLCDRLIPPVNTNDYAIIVGH